MGKLAKNLTELVGNTPLLELSRYNAAEELKATIIAKLEYFNPAGSVKDRIALAMVTDAEAKGVLKPGGTFCGCFYVSGEHKRTDWMIRHVYEPTKFFTPPYETVDSLRKRLQGMYAQVDVGSLKSIAWFICRKAD